LLESELVINKSIAPAVGDANDAFVVTLDINHTANSNATGYNLFLEDILPIGITYQANTLTNPGGVAPTRLTESNGIITANYN
jgi:uncharacterized repeat protein (TIGR01451 family)